MNKDTEFSASMRTLRRKMGYTQLEFANKLGIDKQAISGYENAKHTPSLKMLEKILQIAINFDGSYDYNKLVGFDKKNKKTWNQF